MILDEDKLCILREVDNKKDISQRGLAKSLNFSLGKINYCLKALKKKGLIKIENFQKNNKLNSLRINSNAKCVGILSFCIMFSKIALLKSSPTEFGPKLL